MSSAYDLTGRKLCTFQRGRHIVERSIDHGPVINAVLHDPTACRIGRCLPLFINDEFAQFHLELHANLYAVG